MNNENITTMRVSKSVLKLAKLAAAKEGVFVYQWIENLILRAVQNKEGSNGKV